MLEPEQEQSPPPGVPASNARAQGGPAGEDAAAGGGPTRAVAGAPHAALRARAEEGDPHFLVAGGGGRGWVRKAKGNMVKDGVASPR